MGTSEYKIDWQKRFDALSDSILYHNGYSAEEISVMTEEEKIIALQKLDLITEC